MSVEFGAFLKSLRLSRGLSVEKLAQASGVSSRTISYWESGEHAPGLIEWRGVMEAVRAAPQERVQAAGLLTRRRILRTVPEVQDATDVESSVVGPLTDVGDLLRALRLRQARTQSDVARSMGVVRATVNRWEIGHNLPTDENIDRLCDLLNAFPEERKALLRRRLEPSHWGGVLTWDNCLEQLDIILRTPTSWPLAELTYLALKRQLYLHLGRQSDALLHFAMLESLHATMLWYQERDAESRGRAQRSLAMLGNVFPGDPIHYGMLNLAALQINRVAGKVEAGLRLYESWLPRLKVDAYQIAPLCDMALFCAGRKRHAEQDALLDQAHRLLQTSPATMPYHHDYYGTTYGRMLQMAGKPVEAMAYLPRIDDEATAPRATLTHWAELLIAAGDCQTATRYLNQAARQLAMYPNPRAQREWNALTRQL